MHDHSTQGHHHGGGARDAAVPASNTVQKELFPLVDVDGYAKPTLQIIVEEALASGIEEICIVANPANVEPMRRHFHGLTERAESRRSSRARTGRCPCPTPWTTWPGG